MRVNIWLPFTSDSFSRNPRIQPPISLEATHRELDPAEYSRELEKFAVIPPMRLTLLLKYLEDLAGMLAEIGLQRLKQMETLDILRLNEERLQYVSRHDPLTGLLNRTCFEETLAALDVAPELPAAVMVLDLDGLKLINDSLGHSAGDKLLRLAAGIIRDAAPADAQAFRIGGDEFAILLRQANRNAAEETRRLLSEKIKHHNRNQDSLSLGISAGLAVAECLPLNMQELVKEADANMYRDKILRGQNLRQSNIEDTPQR